MIGAAVAVPVLLTGLTVVLLSWKGSQPAQGPGGRTENKGNGPQGKQGDGPGVGGRTDFSRVDYSKGPNGEKLTEQTLTTLAFAKDQFVNAQVLWTFQGFGGKGTGHPNVTGLVLHGRSVEFIRGTKGPGANAKGERVLLESWHFSGKKHGTYKGWHANGQRKLEGAYSQDRKEGRWQEWYENGRPKLEESFSSGQLHGRSLKWSDDGGKQEEATYAGGKLNGSKTTWYPGGKKESEEQYRDDQRQGDCRYWDEEGKSILEIAFDNGIPRINYKTLTREQFAALLVLTADAQDGKTFSFRSHRPEGVKANPFMSKFGPPVSGYNEPSSPDDVARKGRQQWLYNCTDGGVVVHVQLSVQFWVMGDRRGIENYTVSVTKLEPR